MLIRPFSFDDFPALARFEAAHAGGALLSWRPLFDRVYRSPWSDGHAGWIAEENGSIEALLLTICVPGKFADSSVILNWPAVILASPRGQESGAGGQLALRHFRNVPLAPSMNGTEQGNRLKSMLARHAPAVFMSRYVRIHDLAGAGRFCGEEKHAALSALPFSDQGPNPVGMEACWLQAPPEDIDSLWAAFRSRLALTSERNRETLTWRYVNFPAFTYRFLEIRRQGALEALAVLRFHDTDRGRVCRIVDFVSVPGRSTDAWVATATAAAECGAIYSDFFMVGQAFDGDLKQAGFIVDSPSNALSALPNLLSPIDSRHWIYSFHLGGQRAGENTQWHDPAAVYFTKGDCDRDFPNRHVLETLDQ